MDIHCIIVRLLGLHQMNDGNTLPMVAFVCLLLKLTIIVYIVPMVIMRPKDHSVEPKT